MESKGWLSEEMSYLMKQYYSLLKDYLKEHLTTDSNLINRQRKAAQDKLAKLTKLQFHELATDVYDETKRRLEQENRRAPFLPVRTEFHPKRNQARQKLATLAEPKFKDLAADVLFEVERRFPDTVNVVQVDKNTESKLSTSKQSTPPANTTAKNQDDKFKDPSLNLDSLDNLMADLGQMIKGKKLNDNDDDIEFESHFASHSNFSASSNVSQGTGRDKEKISFLHKRVTELELELENKSRAEAMNRKKFEDQLIEQKDIIKAQERTISELQNKYRQLYEDHNKQIAKSKAIIDESNKIKNDYLAATKKMDNIYSEANSDKTVISKLTNEKNGLEIALREARQEIEKLKSKGSSGTPIVTSYESEKGSERGSGLLNFKYDKTLLATYMTAVDDLNKASMGNIPADILLSMKAIVMATRQISENAEKFEKALKESTLTIEFDYDKFRGLRSQLSSNLTNLISSAKNSATDPSNANSQSLDQNTSILSSIIMDIVQMIKEVSDEDKGPQEAYAGPDVSNFFGSTVSSEKMDDETYKDIKDGLTSQTDSIVQSIQDLLVTMKSTNDQKEIHQIVDSISSTVNQIIQFCTNAFQNELKNSKSFESGYSILEDLEFCNDNLQAFFQSDSKTFVGTGQLDKLTKQKVAACAYDVAKMTKELTNLFE